jgi:hypothetical protein
MTKLTSEINTHKKTGIKLTTEDAHKSGEILIDRKKAILMAQEAIKSNWLKNK